jgi:hypothetical protein
VSAAGQGNGGEKGGELHPLRWDCGTIEGCGAKAAMAMETGERGSTSHGTNAGNEEKTCVKQVCFGLGRTS